MARLLKSSDISKQHKIIAIMGPTGCGKSNLIDRLAGTGLSGSTLKSHTQGVSAILLSENVVLVDTPGFDDTDRTDMQVLKLISDWLNTTYKKEVRLAGIAYLHRITDNRMAGTPHRNLRMFGELCGDKAAEKVILVTTMWDTLRMKDQKAGDESGKGAAFKLGEKREEELKANFWKVLIEHGARTQRFENTTQSGNDLLTSILAKSDDQATLLQEEMVNLGRELNETQAGRALYTRLQSVLEDQKKTMEALQREAQSKNNQAVVNELQKELNRLRVEFNKTFEQVGELKIPFVRRIWLFLFSKKASASSLHIAG